MWLGAISVLGSLAGYDMLLFWQGCLVLTVSAIWIRVGPVRQNEAYHQFADTRTLAGVPNGRDVLSNLFLLAAAVAGLRRPIGNQATAHVWHAFYLGILGVAAGSAYYHWRPCSRRLLWDRLPMAYAFMCLFAAYLLDCTGVSATPALALLPALGVLSVLRWARTGDLRLYGLVQYGTMLVMALQLPHQQSGEMRRRYGGMLAWYVLAKVAEALDRPIYRLTRKLVSGHTLKHLLAAAATAHPLW